MNSPGKNSEVGGNGEEGKRTRWNSRQTGNEQKGEQRTVQLKKTTFLFCRKSSALSLLPHRRRKRIYLVYFLLHPILKRVFACALLRCVLSPEAWGLLYFAPHTESQECWKSSNVQMESHAPTPHTLIDFYVKTLFGFDKWLKPHYSCPVSKRKPSKLHL